MPRRMIHAALVLWLMGCGGDKEAEPEDVSSTPGTEAPSKADNKSKSPNPAARSGKASPRKKGKGKSGEQKARKGQKPTPPNGSAQPSASAPIGIAGTLEGTLEIQLQAEEGKPTTSLASLRLTWEGGEEEVSLGVVPAECKSVSPTPIGPEGKQLVPLWMVDCDGQKADAKIALHQKENTLFVRRALVTGEGMTSPYKVVKRIRLAEDAKVSRAP